MGDPYREMIEDLRRACAMEDCPLAMTVDDLAAEVPAGLEWTKAVLVRDALEVSLRCNAVACCARPFLERVGALAAEAV